MPHTGKQEEEEEEEEVLLLLPLHLQRFKDLFFFNNEYHDERATTAVTMRERWS